MSIRSSERTYTAMKAPSAKGEFFNTEIRGRFRFLRFDVQHDG
jgi:hypothetical protein